MGGYIHPKPGRKFQQAINQRLLVELRCNLDCSISILGFIPVADTPLSDQAVSRQLLSGYVVRQRAVGIEVQQSQDDENRL